MSVPITDNRYFTLGVDDALAMELPCYDSQEYESAYPSLSMVLPQLFSINLKEEIEIFITTVPSKFEITVERAIDLACYYYSDWETMVVVIDEFLQTEVFYKAEKQLMTSPHNSPSTLARLDDEMVTISGAMTRFIGVIISVLTRAAAPAITEYGSCYRFERVDDFGNVFFRLRTPSQVVAELCGGICNAGQNF